MEIWMQARPAFPLPSNVGKNYLSLSVPGVAGLRKNPDGILPDRHKRARWHCWDRFAKFFHFK
jgi:hypothetical protein